MLSDNYSTNDKSERYYTPRRRVPDFQPHNVPDVEPYEFQRPASRVGVDMGRLRNIHIPEYKSKRVKDSTWIRPSFKAAVPKARDTVDFDFVESLYEKQNGIRIDLGDKAIEKLGGVAENVIKSTKAEFKALQTQLMSGQTKTAADIQTLGTNVMNILSEVKNLDNATVPELKLIKDSVDKLNITPDWTQHFPQRVFNIKQYKNLEGPINVFLYSHLDKYPYTIDKPIGSADKKTGSLTLTSAVATLGKKITKDKYDNFLDIEDRKLISRNDAAQVYKKLMYDIKYLDSDVFVGTKVP